MFLIYLDDRDFATMPEDERDAWVGRMEAYDQELISSGNYVDACAMRQPKEAMTVRIRNGNLAATDGPFAETKEHLSGYFVVEARDLNDAVRLAAKMPLANVGAVEVRPLKGHAGEL
jgi:hypothetical protein